MGILLKTIIVLAIIIGLLIFACTHNAAFEGDKKAKKYWNIGFGLFIAGEAAGLALYFIEYLQS